MIIDILLPVSLIFIMFSLGIGLTVNDFRNVLNEPKAFLVGIVNQMLILPIITFLIVIYFDLSSEIAVGMMILACCPGGVTSNIVTKLAKGDTALSISYTAVISIATIGINHNEHDIRFVEDDWESPSLGAAGLGWEVWCNGMEITQFTYFQQMAGIECKPVSVELTYGLERICMFTQGKKNVFDLDWNDTGIKYKEVFHQSEKEFSAYNFEHANTDNLFKIFDMLESESKNLLEKKLSLPAYDQCLKASHVFNILDAREQNIYQRYENLQKMLV